MRLYLLIGLITALTAVAGGFVWKQRLDAAAETEAEMRAAFNEDRIMTLQETQEVHNEVRQIPVDSLGGQLCSILLADPADCTTKPRTDAGAR